MTIRQYNSQYADEWNRFVAQSKNGTFLFDRCYMDYHADRFEDCSLMFYDDKECLCALLPANKKGKTFHSHQGLTYGGVITNERMTAAEMCQLFKDLNTWLASQGITHVVYKPIPAIYHTLPAEEDLYALFLVCHAQLTGRDIASTIQTEHPVKWRRDRRYGANKAKTNGITVEASNDYAAFWQVLNENLRLKYGVRPVHSLEEIELLHSRFPKNIRLYVAKLNGKTIGGTVLYINRQTVHAQYISASPEGKHLHAIDAIYEQILLHDFNKYKFIDFGKSTEEHGYNLNETLIYQKGGFGGRGICYDTYEWDIK